MGRHKMYATEEERKQAQREHALKYYYRKKARDAALAQQNDPNQQTLKVTVHNLSKKIGPIDEEVEYKIRADGKLLKKQTK